MGETAGCAPDDSNSARRDARSERLFALRRDPSGSCSRSVLARFLLDPQPVFLDQAHHGEAARQSQSTPSAFDRTIVCVESPLKVARRRVRAHGRDWGLVVTFAGLPLPVESVVITFD